MSKAVCGGCHTMVLGVPIPGDVTTTFAPFLLKMVARF